MASTLVASLVEGGRALAPLADDALLAAWSDTVAACLDPASPERRRLGPALERSCRLSPRGLDGALAAVLGGVCREPFASLLEAARSQPRLPVDDRPVLVVLSSNLPALAVQPLAAAVALRRPALLKSPSSEPFFTPAFLAALARRLPALGTAYAAATWSGGDEAIETPLLAGSSRVLAYGDEAALASLARRAAGRLVAYGPKTSLAIVGADIGATAIVAGLARDVALFDQRGCLSIGAIYTAGDAEELADALAAALETLATDWPPGPANAAELAGVQQVRLESTLRGLSTRRLAVDAGTIVIEPRLDFGPSPGLRTVRIHPVPSLEVVPGLLEPFRGRLQGAALAGADAVRLAPALRALGVSRITAPGALQEPDATWHNGGIHPLDALTGPPPSSIP